MYYISCSSYIHHYKYQIWQIHKYYGYLDWQQELIRKILNRYKYHSSSASCMYCTWKLNRPSGLLSDSLKINLLHNPWHNETALPSNCKTVNCKLHLRIYWFFRDCTAWKLQTVNCKLQLRTYWFFRFLQYIQHYKY